MLTKEMLMGPGDALRFLLRRLRRDHRGLKNFAEEARHAGSIDSAVDRGVKTVSTAKVVGSVSRWQTLRSDFFYRTGKAMTQRFYRIGEAMEAGKALPAVELYKLMRRGSSREDSPQSEYYVVDGHHRVAMARKLGQDFLDAHVTEYGLTAEPSSDPAQTHEIPRPVDPPS
jgi:hypothetical protein